MPRPLIFRLRRVAAQRLRLFFCFFHRPALACRHRHRSP
ncbi:hypothetical protein BURPS1106B_A2220 [Burkholderia pseudomallei 1106b]|uniref:Uncharacterized protein n=2 Tax=pseudomallei group TaxID=111527 RepID=A2S4X3_BURM9|nr:hypothetical protein BMA10229_A1004 [Burkholderia mallei NCTC 10229]ABN88730.1 hypothetical protein BURPS1106A_3003 [Burkholderia pseudomallei 1106a]AFR16890.1 hypothetical protein BPC006_I3039 [Burkholderia pseudomallei BPC006]EBA50887.1 hypothetical protein BURPS305_7719 [Burkholderia pseudomallei 305]EDO95262.1 conserved hypothetical protein [Burkholderia pseudomallei Pasteur 52237]EEH26154.1 conserved hypothetical protein [Burkholderia pseudomallei Pakistan 9]EES25061.1 hypothetical pr